MLKWHSILMSNILKHATLRSNMLSSMICMNMRSIILSSTTLKYILSIFNLLNVNMLISRFVHCSNGHNSKWGYKYKPWGCWKCNQEHLSLPTLDPSLKLNLSQQKERNHSRDLTSYASIKLELLLAFIVTTYSLKRITLSDSLL